MKQKALCLVPALFLSICTLPAANIAWVSLHPADETPSGTAATSGFTNAPDVGYTRLLAANGHTVTRFVASATPDTASLNTNDLVILSRGNGSGNFQNEPSPTLWNGVTAPMMILNGYLTRGSRLGLTTGDTIPDVTNMLVRLKVNVPAHPIFNGISLDATNTMVNTFAQRVTFTNSTGTALQTGISVNTSAPIAGGSVLATVGTGGDPAFGGMIIGEFTQGLTTARTNALGAKRLVFFTGSREAGIAGGQGAGIYDLLPDGEKMFLNAVGYMLSKSAPVVSVAPVLGTNLFPGDVWTIATTNTYGSDPISFQWYKGDELLAGKTSPTLAFASLTAQDAGDYRVVATNPYGSSTSGVARIEMAVLPQANITNNLISYWPLDTVVGSKTPDLVSGYDMTLVNMGATNLTPGKWGNAFAFDTLAQNSMERVNNGGDALPISQFPDFSVSLWVYGGIQSDHRVFAEGSTTNTNPMLSIGTHNSSTAPDATVDVYIRNNTGGTVGDHRHSTANGFTYEWHNIVYVQRDVGSGMKAQLWIDGSLDPVQITPVRPLTANATAIGAVRRSGTAGWFTGSIDEVAVWNRAITPQEVAILQLTSITNPPVRTQPLAINSFKADLPAVVTNMSTTLRWDVSKDASQVTISPLGDVTAQTQVGVGSRTITLTQPATYVLTVQRGLETLTATTKVAVVQNVAPGWALLDNFDQYSPGNMFAIPYWNDVTGNSATVVDRAGNPAMRTPSATYLNLRNLAVTEEQARTLFFRLIVGPDNVNGITNIVGLTDKSQRGFGDNYFNVGPVLYPVALTNTTAGLDTNAWFLGARNGWYGQNSSAPVDFPLVDSVTPLETGAVYNVWIDITNAPIAWGASDYFSVYVQKEGAPQRTLLFQDYQSDRDLNYLDPVLGGISPVLDKLIVMCNNAGSGTLYDDFYLSTSGYNSTLPRAYGFTGPAGPLPALQILWSSGQIEIRWSAGTLQESTSVTGGWTDIPNAAPPSLRITPAPGARFYRARP